MKQIKKFLQLTIFIAIFCAFSFYTSHEYGELSFKESVVRCALSMIYAGLAGIAVICIEQAERSRHGRFQN